MHIRGGCRCGKARYEVPSPPLFIHTCHCMDCQNATGSAFIINIFVDGRDLQTSGDLSVTELPTGSGAGRDMYACAVCGTQLWTTYRRASYMPGIRAGTLDDTSTVCPGAHIFTKDKQPWVILPTDAPAFEVNYDRHDVWPSESLKRFEEISGTSA